MVRYFSNPFGWDWLPRGEDIYDISSGDTWGFSNTWSPYFDKWEDLNAADMDSAIRMIEGTAKSMGLVIKGSGEKVTTIEASEEEATSE